MPIEVGIWRLGEKLNRIEFESIESEKRLEDTLQSDLSVLGPGLMLVGRQVPTAFGKFIDLLAMDRDGNLVIIELKRDRTPRNVVAQALDYASWVDDLSYEHIADLYAERNDGKKFEAGFHEAFDGSPPEDINESHRIIIVATEIDPSTERIVNYLNRSFGVPINTVFFRYFKDAENEYLTRTWLINPLEAEVETGKSAKKKSREPWNGRNFYVSLGEGPDQNWDDCRKYGFICGGGGRWYTQTLEALFPGARVFVNIPKTGYVGVGIVKGASTPAKDFKVSENGKSIPILDVPLVATEMGRDANDLDVCQYLVRVEWIKAVSRDDAYWEKGLFASQHTACRLRNRFTIERLTEHFGLED